MKEIGIGIIGFGYMGKAHTYGYTSIPYYYQNPSFKTRLVGVCTAHLETADKAKEQYGFSFGTTNIDDIMSCKDIDVVNICTPNIYHKEAALKAAKMGKHIYCDKPLAAGYQDACEIVRNLKTSSSITQMTFQNRFFPATLRAKQLMDEGKMGRILSFRASYLHSGSVDPHKVIGWKQDKDLGGGGVLLDLGAHILDLVYHLLGEYASLMAKTEILYPKRPTKDGSYVDIAADDMALMMVTMKNGGTGVIEASKIATGTNDELRLEIHGDCGSLRLNLMDPNYLEYYNNTLSDHPLGGCKGYTKIECVQRYEQPGGVFVASKASIGWIRSHIHCLYNFLNCVSEGKPASPSIEEGAYIQYIMEKAYESDRKSAWVTL